MLARKGAKRDREGSENAVEKYERRPRAGAQPLPPAAAAAVAGGAAPRPRGNAPGGARGAPVAMPSEDKAARKAAKLDAKRAVRKEAQLASAKRPAAEKRLEIARTAHAVLADPEKLAEPTPFHGGGYYLLPPATNPNEVSLAGRTG
ncbi:hypothetical protein T492DRAFT_836484 [Pavlovales sp. CCMP2436]|nr:hypothetical protein T492DRAFT_836484 [Pavlovales sp. CCMP2436]